MAISFSSCGNIESWCVCYLTHLMTPVIRHLHLIEGHHLWQSSRLWTQLDLDLNLTSKLISHLNFGNVVSVIFHIIWCFKKVYWSMLGIAEIYRQASLIGLRLNIIMHLEQWIKCMKWNVGWVSECDLDFPLC